MSPSQDSCARTQARLPRSLALICLSGLLALACTACRTGGPESKLPENALVAAEDFGLGLRPLMSAADAKAVKAAAGVDLVYLTPEKLLTHDPGAEKKQQRDLIYVVEAGELSPLDGAGAVAAAGQVQELRCYLCGSDKSPLTLGGQPAAGLDPDSVQELFGPGEVNQASDGNTHITWRFAVPGRKDAAYKLVTSHDYSGACYQMLLAVERRS